VAIWQGTANLRLATPTELYVFSAMVELVALRRVAPRSAAQHFHLGLDPVPPLNAAGLSQRDNRYR
jgi:hypothetical protein